MRSKPNSRQYPSCACHPSTPATAAHLQHPFRRRVRHLQLLVNDLWRGVRHRAHHARRQRSQGRMPRPPAPGGLRRAQPAGRKRGGEDAQGALQGSPLAVSEPRMGVLCGVAGQARGRDARQRGAAVPHPLLLPPLPTLTDAGRLSSLSGSSTCLHARPGHASAIMTDQVVKAAWQARSCSQPSGTKQQHQAVDVKPRPST